MAWPVKRVEVDGRTYCIRQMSMPERRRLLKANTDDNLVVLPGRAMDMVRDLLVLSVSDEDGKRIYADDATLDDMPVPVGDALAVVARDFNGLGAAPAVPPGN